MEYSKIVDIYLNWKAGSKDTNIRTYSDYINYINNYLIRDNLIRFAPTQVSISITESCNLDCIHCYQSRSDLNMDFHYIKDLFKQLKAEQVIELVITGGEPLLHPNFIEILKLAKEYRFITHIQSNGLCFDDNIITNIKNIINSETDTIQISLEGSNEEIHHRQRHSGFIQVIENIKRLVAKGIKVNINITPTNINQNDIFKTFMLANDLGVHGFGATPLAYLGKGTSILEPDRKTVIEQETMILLQREVKTKYLGGVSGETLHLSHIPEFVEKLKTPECNKDNYMCNAGVCKAHVDVLCNVFPCVFAQNNKFKLGNLLENSFSEIWYSDYAKSEFLSINRDLNDTKCKSCLLVGICNGGCPALAYEKYNSINYPDPRCLFKEV